MSLSSILRDQQEKRFRDFRDQALAFDGDSPAGFPAVVQVIEPLGMTTQLTVGALGTTLTVMALERVKLATGQRVSLAAAADPVHVFARDSGRRIN